MRDVVGDIRRSSKRLRKTWQRWSLVWAQWSREHLGKRFYPTYTTDQLIEVMKSLGLKPGITLFVHSSWDEFYRYQGKPSELIRAILDVLGPEGTLGMPAFPVSQDSAQIFDIRRTPTGAGMLAEMFRRFPGIKRSINLNHSVCCLGPQADYLTRDHHHSVTSWDMMSPYFRLREVDALIMGLGVGHDLKIATSLHCADSLLRDEVLYFNRIFQEEVTYRWRDAEGRTGEHTFLRRTNLARLNTRRLARLMDPVMLMETRLSNLDLYRIPARYLIDRAVELGRIGITSVHTQPRPVKELFVLVDSKL